MEIQDDVNQEENVDNELDVNYVLPVMNSLLIFYWLKSQNEGSVYADVEQEEGYEKFPPLSPLFFRINHRGFHVFTGFLSLQEGGVEAHLAGLGLI